MKLLKFLITIIGTTLMGMFGGQKNKGVRRFGIAGLAISIKPKLKHLVFLLFIPILSLGYGENSWLMGILHNDALVRISFGACLSIPFWFYGLKRGLFALIALCLAFSVRAGSFGQIWGMDILIEDMVRYGVLGILIAFNLFVEVRKKE